MNHPSELLNSQLLNKTLNDIEFFDQFLEYISPDDKLFWLVDGGIQLKIDDAYFSFAWSYDDEFFNLVPKKVNEISQELQFQNLEAKQEPKIKNLIGSTITHVESKWNTYQDLDDDLQPSGEIKYMPLEIIIHFSNLCFLQIAAIRCEVDDLKLLGMFYNSESDLLISLNKKVEIKEEE